MWKVYIRKIVTDPKYGNRTVEIEQCEGNREYCERYAAEHPGTYIAVSYTHLDVYKRQRWCGG